MPGMPLTQADSLLAKPLQCLAEEHSSLRRLTPHRGV